MTELLSIKYKETGNEIIPSKMTMNSIKIAFKTLLSTSPHSNGSIEIPSTAYPSPPLPDRWVFSSQMCFGFKVSHKDALQKYFHWNKNQAGKT